MCVVQDLADCGRGTSGLRRVACLGSVLPVTELFRDIRLPLNVDVDGPLGDEPLERGQVGSLPRLVGGLIQLPREGMKGGGGDLRDGLAKGRDSGRRLRDE